jgi:hypothetical protein
VTRLFATPARAGAAGSVLRADDDGQALDDPRFAGADVLVHPVQVPGDDNDGAEDGGEAPGLARAGAGSGETAR